MYRLICVQPEKMIHKFRGKCERIHTEKVELSVDIEFIVDPKDLFWPYRRLFYSHPIGS